MKLTLVATPPLHPFLKHMLRLYRLDANLISLPWRPAGHPAFLRDTLAAAEGCDAALLLDGAYAVPEEGLTAGSCPLVVPRVHNCAALLLGGADRYRGLFDLHRGEIGWHLPEAGGVFFTPRADCSCLCHLADTELGLRDDSIIARAEAMRRDWDFFNEACDYTLLKKLLAGGWDDRSIVTVRPHGTIAPTYTHDLLAAE